ncbi:MAG: hypothetical protein EBZ29_01115 [Synechococcaceae bacterium WB9_4xC_028]|jgi:hypothetical protein|nr:hypothetical protein [Synechococcaceae bacterium WB9_4xB_025]NDD68021.1 hypothetical protein [Synechococcaceae bacterium WB9_4xC_028]TCD58717.1 hypothetical protein CWE17_06540 [Synechococcus sp. BS56D]
MLLLVVASRAGATVIHRPLCDGPLLVGHYFSGSNVFCLSTELIHTEDQVVETISHELVHVAQDCAGGGIASDRYALLLSKEKPSVEAAEREAYALESDPEQVMALVRRHCYGSSAE